MPRFACDRCGGCCKYFLIEADQVDILREPRLADADPYYCGRPIDDILRELRDECHAVFLGGVDGCPFLASDDTCSIYPTRPSVCVAMEAGDEQCQQARELEALPPLEPVEL